MEYIKPSPNLVGMAGGHTQEQERLLQEEKVLPSSSFDLGGTCFRFFQEEANDCFDTPEVSQTGG